MPACLPLSLSLSLPTTSLYLTFRANKYLLAKFAFLPQDVTIRRTERLPPKSLVVPFATTEHYRKSFTATASRLLNELGITTFHFDLLEGTKSFAQNHFFEQEKQDWELRKLQENITKPQVELIL